MMPEYYFFALGDRISPTTRQLFSLEISSGSLLHLSPQKYYALTLNHQAGA